MHVSLLFVSVVDSLHVSQALGESEINGRKRRREKTRERTKNAKPCRPERYEVSWKTRLDVDKQVPFTVTLRSSTHDRRHLTAVAEHQSLSGKVM